MTGTATTAEGTLPPTERAPNAVPRKAAALARGAYEVVLGGPMEEGRLSLKGLAPGSRGLAIGALVALAAMLGSLLFNESWRAGALVSVGALANPALLPQALVPVTLVAFFVAWLAVLWGAFKSCWGARLVVAALFALLNATMARPVVWQVGSSLSARWAPDLALAAYALVPGVVIFVPLAITSLAKRRPSLAKRSTVGAFFVLAAGTGCFYGATLWAQAGELRAGTTLTVPSQLEGSILSVEAFLVPMVLVSVLSIVKLSYSVAEAGTGPFWGLAPAAAKASVGALLALKLWLEVANHASYWHVYLRQREAATVRTLLGLALLGALAVVARRLRPRARASEEAAEGVAFASALVFSLPVLIVVLVEGTRALLVLLLPSPPSFVTALRLPSAWQTASSPIFWALVLAAAAAMVVRHRSSANALREAALGLGLVAVWAEFFFVPEAFGYEPGFNPKLLDVALTVAVSVYLLVRLRSLTSRQTVWLGAMVGLSWLVSAQGDVVALLGSLAGLPTTVVLAVGIVYALLTDSEFARRTSASLPGSARPLLWVGYLLLSATLANWVLAVHGGDPVEGPMQRGFEMLGLPLAAWLLTWRPFERIEAFEADEQA